MGKQILGEVPQGVPLIPRHYPLGLYRQFIIDRLLSLEYESLPGSLPVINSEARGLSGPVSTVIKKPCRKEEAAILAQLISHQTVALRNRQDMTGWHVSRGAGGGGEDPLATPLYSDAANCPAVFWLGLVGGVWVLFTASSAPD